MPEPKEAVVAPWVPVLVVETAQRLADSPELVPDQALPILERLVCDPRMELVWTELNKRKRENYIPTEVPFHPSVIPQAIESWAAMGAAWRARAAEYRELGSETEARRLEALSAFAEGRDKPTPNTVMGPEARHQLALATFFVRAVALYCSGVRTVTAKQVQKEAQSLRTAGAEDAAEALGRHAQRPENQAMIVERHRSNPRIEAFIEGLAATNRALFGKDLPSVIAIMANVAFLPEKAFDRDRVRAILKLHPPAMS